MSPDRLTHAESAEDLVLPSCLRGALSLLTWPAWIVGVEEDLALVRLDTRRGLARARARLDEIRSVVPPGEPVVWILPNPNGWGLDPDEARAVADQALAVDRAFAIEGPEETFTVIVGRVRREVVGFLLSFCSREPAALRRLYRHANRLRRAGVPCAAVLVSVGRSRPSVDVAFTRAVWTVARRLCAGAAMGIWVRRGGAVSLPWPGAQIIRFEHPDQRRGTRDDEETTVLADLSWAPVGNPRDTPDAVERAGAWLPAGAYRGLSFDSRVPAARLEAAGPLQVVRVPAGRGFADTWAHCRGPRPDLPVALDYYRFESYLRRSADVGLAQRYHEFKVYLNSHGGPEVRTTLIEVDDSVSDGAGALLVEEAAAAVRRCQGTMTIESGAAFFAAASREAELRIASAGPAVLERQREAHVYLQAVGEDEPLRADVTRLVSVMPAELGSTLELGAGLGRLARELTPRSLRYVCLDLQAATMPAPSGRLSSVVGDLQRLPFAAAAFDSIIANNVLEHAADPVGALREVGRLLRPGGRMYALIPLDALNSDYDLPAHLWKADMRGIAAAAAQAGLRIHQAEAVNLYALGIAGCFPSCFGWVCLLVAGGQEV